MERYKEQSIEEFQAMVAKIENDIKDGKYNNQIIGNIPSALRHKVWTTYASEIYRKCFCCRSNEIEESNFECGHIISRHNGGPITLENLRPICSQCNRSMSTKNMCIFIKQCGFWGQEHVHLHAITNFTMNPSISPHYSHTTYVPTTRPPRPIPHTAIVSPTTHSPTVPYIHQTIINSCLETRSNLTKKMAVSDTISRIGGSPSVYGVPVLTVLSTNFISAQGDQLNVVPYDEVSGLFRELNYNFIVH